MQSTNFWLDTSQRPIQAWLHLPDNGAVRAAILMCPPVGIEYQASYSTYRKLAEALTTAGMGVVRFDYPGTGDSLGTLFEPNLVASWTSTIVDIIDVVRKSGAPEVGVIGMRLGATLAAPAIRAAGAVHSFVVWDPCVSGRSFLRSQRMLSQLAVGENARPDQAFTSQLSRGDLPGYFFPLEVLDDLTALAPSEDGTALAKRALLLGRSKSAVERTLKLFPAHEVDTGTAKGQDRLIEVPVGHAEVPSETMSKIVEWFNQTTPSHSAPMHIEGRDEVIVATTCEFGDIVERSEFMGPDRNFSIVTEPAVRRQGSPTIFFCDVAQEHRIGPGRLWVELARELARQGLRSVRFDFSGIGDTPPKPGVDVSAIFTRTSLTEFHDVVRAGTDDEPSRSVIVGLCSGGYHALEVGYAMRSMGVCALNVILDLAPPADADGPVAADEPVVSRAVLTPRGHFIGALTRRPKIKALKGRIPRQAWRALDGLHLLRSPAHGLVRLVDRGVSTLLICGPEDAAPFEQRGYWLLRRAERSGRFQFERMDDLDHALLLQAPRERVFARIRDYILTNFAKQP